MRWAALGLVATLSACELDTGPPPQVDVGTFPYHPVVYELDLAILSYQVHGQSMVWPIDPFYEEHAGDRGTPRDDWMALVRGWAGTEGAAQVDAGAGLDAYRGPGVLAGLPDNPTHDPILYDYARIHPWSPTITNNDGQWTEYLTPREITGRIRDVYVSARAIGGGGAMALTQVAPGRDDADPDATDVLCAFEGGTGDRGLDGQPASYSLMGFVLARDRGDGGYDIHVTFRGSRSGSATRAALDALSSDQAKGNPDWITDLGWDAVQEPAVTRVGSVHRGFAHAMTSILPGAVQCLENAANLRGAPPVNIYVTGHSLGGGLAQHFASAMLLGDARDALPAILRGWPWDTLKLVTFSAPRAGDYTWASTLSGALDSRFYDPGPLETIDADALPVLDPSIAEALLDPSRPAAFRVLISTDPISTTKLGGDGTHVGATVYVNGTSVIDWLGVDTPTSHEPVNVRADMVDAMEDPRTPPIAWRYRPLTDLVPDRDASAMGTPAEMHKLADGLLAYYRDGDLWFDEAAFTRDLDLMLAIDRGAAN